jgi:nitroreductase
VDLADLLARRRMVRSFDGSAVDLDLLEGLCATALLAPTAGHSAGVRMRVVAPARLDDLLEAATDAAWRATSTTLDGIARAGAAVVVSSRVGDYLARYAEPDKAGSGLERAEAWPVPYWHADAAMATMALLLLLEEAEIQAGLWGNFRHERRVLDLVGASDELLLALVFVGRGDGADARSASLRRTVPRRRERVTRID